jgi:hypothetical protein
MCIVSAFDGQANAGEASNESVKMMDGGGRLKTGSPINERRGLAEQRETS